MPVDEWTVAEWERNDGAIGNDGNDGIRNVICLLVINPVMITDSPLRIDYCNKSIILDQ